MTLELTIKRFFKFISNHKEMKGFAVIFDPSIEFDANTYLILG